MRTVNSVILLGSIVKDPDLKMTLSGKEFATFTLSTSRDSLKGGVSSEFHSIVAWGVLAQIVISSCQKGKNVYIEGYLKTRSWEIEGGKKMYRTEVIATNIIPLSLDSLNTQSTKNLNSMFSNKDFFAPTEEDFFTTKDL